MATRLPASQHTREELTALIEGRLSTASAKDELVRLATRLIVGRRWKAKPATCWDEITTSTGRSRAKATGMDIARDG